MPKTSGSTLELPLFDLRRAHRRRYRSSLCKELGAFDEFGTPTRCFSVRTSGVSRDPLEIPVFVNEFWTARQRAGNSLHEISYRACFKPQLPRFFIERLTVPGATVYDPFSGRGTTALEAALLGRIPIACDVNPLSRILLEPRLDPPALPEITARLASIPWSETGAVRDDLLVFYHPETLRDLSALRRYLLRRESSGAIDRIDRWL